MYGGPNPEDGDELIRVLRCPGFVNELRLVDAQIQAIEDLASRKPEADAILAFENPVAVIEAYKASQIIGIQECLTPDQFARLINLCFRIEIGLLGFENSLAYGRLADAVGVYDNQRTRVRDRVAAIRAAMRRQREAVEKQAEEDVILSLPVSLQAATRDRIGEFFAFRNAILQPQNAKPHPARDRTLSFLALYQSMQVREELNISAAQIEAIEDVSKKAMSIPAGILSQLGGSRPTDDEQAIIRDATNKFLNVFDEVLTPSQVRRLDQITLRKKVRDEGYQALLPTESFEPGEYAMAVERIGAIMKKAQAAITALEEQMEVRIGKEVLTPEQHRRLDEAIGAVYTYTPVAYASASPMAVYPK